MTDRHYCFECSNIFQNRFGQKHGNCIFVIDMISMKNSIEMKEDLLEDCWEHALAYHQTTAVKYVANAECTDDDRDDR